MITIKPQYVVEIYPEERWFPKAENLGRRYKMAYDDAYYIKEKILELKRKGELEDVNFVVVQNKDVYKTPDGEEFSSIYQALAHWFEYEERYVYSYKGIFDQTTTSSVTSFKDLIEAAYRDPVDFKLISAKPELSKEQQEFLEKVVQLGLEERAMRSLAE